MQTSLENLKSIKPLLTVVMPVFNGERHIKEAIDSVLAQTFTDFELIVINDGSSDYSVEIVNSFSDTRVKLLNNDKNRGIPYSRNRGLREAQGQFLCWTDCDDVNLPERFAKQLHFLQNNTDYGGCGTWIERFKGEQTYYIDEALEDWKEIEASLLFKPATMPNPTVMLRLGKIKEHEITYNPNLTIGEDYDFIYSCAKIFKFTNLQETLYKYRDSETSIMNHYHEKENQRFKIISVVYRRILGELGIEPTQTELFLHFLVCSDKIFDHYEDFLACYDWLQKIKTINLTKGRYDKEAMESVLAEQFFYMSKKASKFGMKTCRFFIQHSRKNDWSIQTSEITKLAVRCILRHDKFEFKQRWPLSIKSV